MVRLFLLYAILIFAKKAPKMITDLLNIKSEGVGLKGLNIKNKLGEAALVGDKVKKGLTGIEGRTKGAVGGAVGGFVRAKGGLAERLSAAGAGAAKGYVKGKHDALQNGDTKGIFSGSYKEMGNIASGGRTSFFNKPKEWLSQADDNLVKKLGQTANRDFNPKKYYNPQRAENQEKLNKLKVDLTKRYGADKADLMLKHALDKAGKKFVDGSGKSVFDIANEEHWMYLTSGKVFDSSTGKYASDLTDPDFKGLKDAVDYSGKDDSYTFDKTVKAEMNMAYRFSNIATNIDKKKSIFEEASQAYVNAKMSGYSGTDLTKYQTVMQDAFKKYVESLNTANAAGLIQGNFVVDPSAANCTINGKGVEDYSANVDAVKADLNKQISELKNNTDSMMQKEEIKQKQESEKN